MLPKEFLNQAEALMWEQTERYPVPRPLVELALKKAEELARKLDANIQIVRAGALLMDSQVGAAIAANKIPEHRTMAAAKARELFARFPEISSEVQANLLACIAEHHGAEKFTTLESEICCNADCYKFASIQGFFLAMRGIREMPPDELADYLLYKVEEKWHALSLDECKQELRPQYQLIKQFLAQLKR
jgi:hypothetical protein